VTKPDDAFEQQIALYRRMSGAERLDIALGLHELACERAREGLRRQFPQADPAEVERHWHDHIRIAATLNDD
jgi:hypothetical protein